jgi:anaerobic C4-dicarboxylate transporter
MLYDLYMFDHNILHICFWTLPAIIVGVIMLTILMEHNHKQKKREKEFEEQLEEKINSLTMEELEAPKQGEE